MSAKIKQISALPVIAALLLLLCAALCPEAMAKPGLPATNSLTVCCTCEGDALGGVTFDLYRVASREDVSVFTPVEPFTAYSLALDCSDQSQWDALALTVKGYIQRDGLAPLSSGTTDAAGEIVFRSLQPGFYLVVGSSCEKDGYRYETAPFFMALPAADPTSGAWLSDALALPKTERSVIPAPGDTVTRKVLKIWNDAACETSRPAQITVQLLQNGVLYDTVTLCPENNWRYTWEDLPAENEWTMAEQVVPGYTALVAQKGITFTVTNTAVTSPTSPDTPSLPVLPQTGQLWWPVPVLAAIGLLLLVLGLMRRKGEAS